MRGLVMQEWSCSGMLCMGAPCGCEMQWTSSCEVGAVGVRVSGFGFWVPSSGVQVPGFGFYVPCFRFRVRCFGFRVSGFGFRVPGRSRAGQVHLEGLARSLPESEARFWSWTSRMFHTHSETAVVGATFRNSQVHPLNLLAGRNA